MLIEDLKVGDVIRDPKQNPNWKRVLIIQDVHFCHNRRLRFISTSSFSHWYRYGVDIECERDSVP